MSTNTNKIPLDFFEFADHAQATFVVVDHRPGRMPVSRAIVTPAGAIEITGTDGLVEVMGSPDYPCSAAVLKRIRTHHEGLLLVQVDASRVDGVAEQLLSARFN
jgi:hypothetical protein